MKKNKYEYNPVVEGYLKDLRFTLKEYHKGLDMAITAKELGVQFDKDKEVIRYWVKLLRERGVPICSGQTGYWYAANVKEVWRCANWLENMVVKIAKTRVTLLAAAIRDFDPFTVKVQLADR